MNKIFIGVLFLIAFSSCYTSKPVLTYHTKPVEVTNTNFKEQILEYENVSVLYFWAVWCGPCKISGPILDELAGTEIGLTKYGKVNVDENPEIAAKYSIRSIPTILFIKNGEVRDKYVGVFSKELVGKKVRGINSSK